jgi:hypothetical protein
MTEPNLCALPEGRTCGECVFFAMCGAHFHRLAADTECEWSPCLFAPEPPPITFKRPAPRKPDPELPLVSLKANPNQARKAKPGLHRCAKDGTFTVSAGTTPSGVKRRICKICRTLYNLSKDAWVEAIPISEYQKRARAATIQIPLFEE